MKVPRMATEFVPCPNCGGAKPAVRGGNHRFTGGPVVRDPLYVGPAGHCPPNLCAECWEAHWQEVLALIDSERDWREEDKMLWLRFNQGLGVSDTAKVLKVHRGTIWRRMRKLKKSGRIPILAQQNTPSRVRTLGRGIVQ